jgi:micrococcal nuclease
VLWSVSGGWHAHSVRTPLALAAAVLLVSCVAPTTATVTVTSTATRAGSASVTSHADSSSAGRASSVLRVVDGDTVHVSFGGRDVTIRFIGVDTPETVAPGLPIECYGPEASRFTTRQLSGRRVRLEFDVERIDPYGRTLAYVWMPDGSMFNETLVRRGFAMVATYPPDTRYVPRFEAAERAAKAADRGLWGAC